MKKIALALVSWMLFSVLALAADPDWQAVESSLIERVAYDAETRTLSVQMHNSSDTYLYKDVPPSLFEKFLEADSKGAFYVKKIKNQFETIRK